MPPASLIIGCGYLGRRLASRLVAQGLLVYGSTRTPAHAARLAQLGVRPLLISVDQPVTLAALRPALQAEELDAYYLIPPANQSARDATLAGIHNVRAALKPARLRRAVMTSSTAVYGQTDGKPVDADTPPKPADDRARILLDAERAFLDSDARFHVLRLAGLYGPGRVIGLAALRGGAPLVGNPHAPLNLIHVDDAADLLIAVMRAESPGQIELGCDNTPTPRQAYYEHLARMINAAPPAILNDPAAAALGLDPARLRNASAKACDNAVTRQRTGWQPRYYDYRIGLEQALAESEPERGR